MANPVEVTIINQIALNERAIAGVKNSYDFAQNPDSISQAQLPCVLHYIPNFGQSLAAHHNVWKVELEVKSILCVAPREGQSGKLKFLENSAFPFGYKWREKFQDHDVITSLLAAVPSAKFFLKGGEYGAGGTLLTVNATEFIGYVFSFEFLTI